MTTRTDSIRDVLGGPIAWRSSGSEELPLAVFLHGLSGDRFAWDPQLAELGDVRHCAAWELPGYGESTGLPGSLPQLADLAADWIAVLGGGPADVVGLSFGGMVAQHLALNHPQLVRSLALLDTSPAFGLDGKTTSEQWVSSRITPLRQGNRVDRAQAVVAGLVGGRCPEHVRDQVVESMSKVPADSLEATCRALVHHDTRARLHDVSAPTLVMVGAEDLETPLSYAEELASNIAGAELVVVPEAGHILNLEAPIPVNDALRHHWATADKDI